MPLFLDWSSRSNWCWYVGGRGSSVGSNGEVEVETEDEVTLAFFFGPGLLLFPFSLLLSGTELSLLLLRLPFRTFVLLVLEGAEGGAPLLAVLSLRLPEREPPELGLSLALRTEVELDFLFLSPAFCCCVREVLDEGGGKPVSFPEAKRRVRGLRSIISLSLGSSRLFPLGGDLVGVPAGDRFFSAVSKLA